MRRSAHLAHVFAGVLIAVPAQAAIGITTEHLPPGRVGAAYSVQLTQTGGTDPRWSVTLGELPPGLQLAANGVILGIPTSAGQYAARIRVEDMLQGEATADFVLIIDSQGSIGLATTSLPEASIGVPFMFAISASGGTAPYGYQIIGGAPQWLFMASDGNMSGTPDAEGTHPLTISIIDSDGASGSGMINLVVRGASALGIDTTADRVPPGVVGTFYEFRFEASGGTEPYAWSLSGSLPSGLAFHEDTGIIEGTPTAEADAMVTVSVIDDESAQASLPVRIVIAGESEELRITLPSRIQLPFNTETRYPLTAAGGTPPYRWHLAGDLPAGLVMTGDAIEGTATSSVAALVTLTVLDDAEDMASSDITVHATNGDVSPRPPSSGGGRVGGSRRGSSGCACARPSSELPLAAPILLLGLCLLVVRRRDQRQRLPRGSR